jgi:hypothetical protein
MICPACGFANEDGALFCDKCKMDLEMPAPPVQASTPMSDQTETPAAPNPSSQEPIALEPVPLEPVATPTPATLDRAGSPITDTPVQQAPAATEPAPEPSLAEPDASPPPLPPKVEPAPEPSTMTLGSGPLTSPKLVVVRGQRMDVQYPLYPGKNYLGRTDDKPVDIDLEDQESQDRIWTSRQHAVITFEDGKLTVEDLNSLNGTFVNRTRVHPGQLKDLAVNDVIQVGTVHLKVIAG